MATPDYKHADFFFQAFHCLRLPPEEKREVKWIVIHSTETSPRTALSIAKQWSMPTYPYPTSAHYIVQPDRVVQCVLENDVAYAAGAANRFGIHVEHVGRERAFPGLRHKSLAAGWSVAPEPRTVWCSNGPPWNAEDMLRTSAWLVADITIRHSASDWVRFIDAEAMLRFEVGITTHNEVTKACHLAKARNMRVAPWFRAEKPPEQQWARSDHGDPDGEHHDWPWPAYLKQIQDARAQILYGNGE